MIMMQTEIKASRASTKASYSKSQKSDIDVFIVGVSMRHRSGRNTMRCFVGDDGDKLVGGAAD